MANLHVYESECGRYRVRRSIVRYGPRNSEQGLAVVVYAQRLDARGNWINIGKHRKVKPAQKRCQADAALAVPWAG